MKALTQPTNSSESVRYSSGGLQCKEHSSILTNKGAGPMDYPATYGDTNKRISAGGSTNADCHM